jgi:hypothetical protein
MRRQGRFRPTGWVIGAVTVLSMVLTAIAAAPGGAAVPEKEYRASFEMECVVAPGVLNVHLKEKLKVTTVAMGPQVVTTGEEVLFHGAHATIEQPAEQTFANALISVGANEAKGAATNFVLDGSGVEPASLNIAKPAEYPTGVPFFSPVEQNKPLTFFLPSKTLGESALTYTFGPEKVTNASSVAKLEVDAAAAYTEPAPEIYEETGTGIVLEIEGRKSGEHVIGPLKTVCNPPSGVVVAEIPVRQTTTTTTTTTCAPVAPPFIAGIKPNHGPEAGGTQVRIEGGGLSEGPVYFGSKPAMFTDVSQSEVIATAPGGSGTVGVRVERVDHRPFCDAESNSVPFTYEPPVEKAEYKNWKLSGSIADKKLSQAITLPAGSSFNGSGELHTGTGAGSVSGNVSIPPLTSSLKLFGPVAVNLGLTLSATGPLEGTVAKSESVPGDETLSAPLKLNAAITSLGILGLTIPTSCATAEPLALNLVDTLTREELLTKGWSFAGTTSIPRVRCEGGFLSRLFGVILTGLLAGPEDPYSINITAPSG